MSGDEPTMVTVPPRMAQNPMGISRREGASPPRRAMRLTTGRNSAAAPMFCMKLEITPTVAETMAITRDSVLAPSCRILPASRLRMPVLSSPAPMIITAMIDITALLEKPSKS